MAQPPNPRVALLMQRVQAWNAAHPNRQIDQKAELAVAMQEGLSGGIGDGGHAFGPNQENDAGGVLTGKLPNLTPQQKQAWAWSPQGIDSALSGVAGAAGGETGAQAVRDIVTRYERPANPGREVTNALAAYGGVSSPMSSAVGSTVRPAPLPAPRMSTPAVPDRGALVQALLSADSSGDYAGFFGKARAATQAPPPVAPPGLGGGAPAAPNAPAPAVPNAPLPYRRGQVLGNTAGENPTFLQRLQMLAGYEHAPVEINSGFRSEAKQAALYANRANNPNPVAPPGHSLHEQGLAADGTVGGHPLGTLPAKLLAMFGLETVPGDPVHVQVRR